MALVSVIIPAHNAAPFLRETVTSALNQSWPDVEVIVVNDGSTDDTAAVLAPFAGRIRVIDQPQSGVAVARNRGAAAARGTWLAFLDADDVWVPHKLERQLASARSDTQLIYSDRINIGHLDGLPEIQSDLQQMYEGAVFTDVLLGNVITTSSVLMRRSTFEDLGGFSEDPGLPPAEDWDLWLRVAARHRIDVCREPLVKYRLHPAGASRNSDRMNRARIRVVQRALQQPAAVGLGSALKRRIWGLTFATNGWDAARHARRVQAFINYVRAIAYWPFELAPYRELIKVCVGR